MTKIINFFGAPGSGKSTLAAELFSYMKRRHYSVELAVEYAKDMVWEERHNILQDQLYMLAKQNRKIRRLNSVVDYVITDSPILLSCIYIDDSDIYNQTLKQLAVEVFNSYNNTNFFINRNHSYVELGRNQNELESDIIANRIRYMLIANDINYVSFNSNEVTAEQLIKII
ncbi:MAG: AAA family ATPase [Nitrososphaeraceae archaeon]